MIRSLRSTLAAATAGLLALVATSAHAVEDPTVSMGDLGQAETVQVPQRVHTTTVAIPVPEGLAPAFYRGTVQVPADYSGGLIEAYSGEEIIASTPIEVVDNRADVEIPLEELEIGADGYGNLTLRTILDPASDEWCRAEPGVTLFDTEVEFNGEIDNPEAVADFLPHFLDTLDIYVPADTSTAVQNTALELVAGIGAAYSAQGLEVGVEELADGAESPTSAPGDFARQIVVLPGGPALTEVVNPGDDDAFLRLSGTENNLFDQARLLTDSLLPVSAAPGTTAAFGLPGAVDVPEDAPIARNLIDLGNANLSADGIGHAQVRIGISRPLLAEYVSSLEVNLLGSYTPLPDSHAGQITASIGDTVLDSFTADDSGEIDRTFAIPGGMLNRYTELVVEFRSTGDVHCGATQQLGLNIDGETLVTADTSAAPTNLDFQTLPQGLLPRVDVAMSEGDVADLNRAAQIIAGLQSMSSQRLRPEVTPWWEALDAQRPALYIDAGGDRMGELPVPFASTEDTLTVLQHSPVEEQEVIDEIRADGPLSVASLQVAWDSERERMLLAASSNGDPAQLDDLLAWLGEENGRWAQLNGQALVGINEREPVDLALEQQGSDESNSARWVVVALAALFLLIILATAFAVWGRSRKRRG